MKSNVKKTNAARLLDKHAVSYELVPYQVDEQHLEASHVAQSLGEDIRQVFKTIVMQGDKERYFVCVVPGDKEINLKLAAKESGNKKCDTLPLKELLPLTGYIRGGCSPLGMKKQYPTYIDESALNWDTIYVSAGVRGLQLKLSPKDLSNECQASFVKLV
ncbi:MAG: Cys-tRNA(Pro) deacylase [Prevotellaceae bacterium]|nr:Cys-tRNA(Pro) deacylase [Prevotellaceae bacterium]MDD7106980.1 Cys-tRNA(Pro) deacylase [Prevotellaceae bacterium]MDY3295378.1 Cys-tRNA(Pro) deacylase [Bacteroidaceae bacterium]